MYIWILHVRETVCLDVYPSCNGNPLHCVLYLIFTVISSYCKSDPQSHSIAPYSVTTPLLVLLACFCHSLSSFVFCLCLSKLLIKFVLSSSFIVLLIKERTFGILIPALTSFL